MKTIKTTLSPLLLSIPLALAASAQAETPTTESATGEAKALERALRCEKLPQETKKQQWEVANCYFKAEAFEKAIKMLRDISAKNPKDLDAFFIASFNLWKRASALGGEQKDALEAEALEELNRASVLNPNHWRVYLELGDYYYLRARKPERAYKYYLIARQYYEGDSGKGVPAAEAGQKSAIENRIARTNEELARPGEAVSASCLSLHWDPDSKEALERLERLAGSCKRKDFRGHVISKDSKPEDKKK